jgi:hypothetical protein
MDRRGNGGAPGHGGLHPLGQRGRRSLASAEPADERETGERLQPEPAKDQHDQPQPQGRRRYAPGDGQATATATRGIGENLMGKDGGGVRLWHEQHHIHLHTSICERRKLCLAVL